MSYEVILFYAVEIYLNELKNQVKPVVSLLCEEVYLFFASLFCILHSLTFIIHDFPMQQQFNDTYSFLKKQKKYYQAVLQ